MCQQNTGMATPLAATTARQADRPCIHRSRAGRLGSTSPSWNVTSAVMQAVVGNTLLASSPRAATIDDG